LLYNINYRSIVGNWLGGRDGIIWDGEGSVREFIAMGERHGFLIPN